MQRYEFKVIPAPRRGEKAREAKTTEDRFALALSSLMNSLGREGWDYIRADTLPCDERSGLTGTKTTFQTVLVFRRLLAGDPPVGLTAFTPRGDTARAEVPRIGAATDAPTGPSPALGPAAE
jgi:hypothetical protein